LIDAPFTGGIGKAVLGGALALGDFELLSLDKSLLLQPARAHKNSASKKIDGRSLLNIFLRIFTGGVLI
jgi:hypothetical protein